MQDPQSPPPPTERGRGKLIMVLGLLSTSGIIFFVILISMGYAPDTGYTIWKLDFLFAFPSGILALLVGYRKLKRIRSDNSPSSLITLAKTCYYLGIFGTLFSVLSFFVAPLTFLDEQGPISNKDAMINDLNNIFANAYQYRIRPNKMRSGGGTYTGYALPAGLTKNENGTYSVTVINADTVKFTARSVQDSTRTIEVKIDSTGRPVADSWVYGGEFK